MADISDKFKVEPEREKALELVLSIPKEQLAEALDYLKTRFNTNYNYFPEEKPPYDFSNVKVKKLDYDDDDIRGRLD